MGALLLVCGERVEIEELRVVLREIAIETSAAMNVDQGLHTPGIQVVYVLTRGGPYNSTHLFATLAYQLGMASGNLGEGAAVALFICRSAMAQESAILAYVMRGECHNERSLLFFAGIDNGRFKRPVFPGDQLVLESVELNVVRSVFKFAAKATVGDELVAEAQLMAAVRDVKV